MIVLKDVCKRGFGLPFTLGLTLYAHCPRAWICSTRVTPWQDYLPGRDAWLQDLKFQRDLKRDYKAGASCHRIRITISNHHKDHDIIMN